MRKRDQERQQRKRRERMGRIVAAMQAYMASYDQQQGYLDYEDETFIEDVIYGLGIALEPEAHRWGDGLDVFKGKLIDRWLPHLKRSNAASQPSQGEKE